MLEKINGKINVPLLIHGGAGCIEHIEKSYKVCNDIDGYLISSMLHYSIINQTENLKEKIMSNISFIEKNKSKFSNLKYDIPDQKN